MILTTVEPKSTDLLDATPGETLAEDCLDPDFSVEGTGGPSDSGSQAHVGPGNPPPES